MKLNNLFLFIFFLGLFFHKGFGQTYQNVAIPDTTTWLVAQAQLHEEFIDTLYAKNQSDDKIEIWFGSQYGVEQLFLGLLSSNEDNSRLWFTPYGTGNNEEMLIFDLTLEKGDTFYLGSILTTVDTVFYKDNLKYIEFDISTIWDENLRFIEGVGPNISIAWMAHPGILEPYVVCKYDDALFYVADNPNFIDCSIDTTNSEELDNYYEINIYPNPATGQATLSIPNASSFKNSTIHIINLYGQTVKVISIKEKQTQIDLTDLPTGSYLFRFTDGRHQLKTGKIIIH